MTETATTRDTIVATAKANPEGPRMPTDGELAAKALTTIERLAGQKANSTARRTQFAITRYELETLLAIRRQLNITATFWKEYDNV